MAFYFAQFLSGLASAASLFLLAAGLSIIFGVTRIVNFAHGALAMLGAYIAYTLTTFLSGPLGFWGALLLAAIAVAALGAFVEMTLLRRIYRAPELFQLLATFGVSLMLEDIVTLVWGPDDLVGPRAPGLKGAVDVFGQLVPSYDLFLITCGPVVLVLILAILHRTRWGMLVRAATQDREMIGALGVNEKWLFTGVFAAGAFLAGLGGALQIPRDAVNHSMDINLIVDVFVVVVIGGLGSIWGAFVAAILVSEINAFAIIAFPKISLVLIFIVMAMVLTLRPWGLFGRADAVVRTPAIYNRSLWAPLGHAGWGLFALVVALAGLAVFALGPYGLNVGAEILIFVVFALSIHLMASVAGLASFGQAAYFGLGAYGAALAVKSVNLPMEVAIPCGIALGIVGGILFGWFCVRSSGVYFAMLTLAFAQIVWSTAYQWDAVTGGDNGILDVWASAWIGTPAHFYLLALAVAALAFVAHRLIVFSPFGFALRATRDSPLRAEAIGIRRIAVQWAAFVLSAAFAGTAGALFAFLKGSVFTDVLGIPLSIDGLVMVLLGGIETVSGAVVGAVAYKALEIWLISKTDLSKLVLGAVIVGAVLVFPLGLLGTLEMIGWRQPRVRGHKILAPVDSDAVR